MGPTEKARRKFTAAFKAQVAIDALKERESLAALATRFDLHPNQISHWKRKFIENSQKVFSGTGEKEKEEPVNLEALYTKIGQLEMEQDFLKKAGRRAAFKTPQEDDQCQVQT